MGGCESDGKGSREAERDTVSNMEKTGESRKERKFEIERRERAWGKSDRGEVRDRNKHLYGGRQGGREAGRQGGNDHMDGRIDLIREHKREN